METNTLYFLRVTKSLEGRDYMRFCVSHELRRRDRVLSQHGIQWCRFQKQGSRFGFQRKILCETKTPEPRFTVKLWRIHRATQTHHEFLNRSASALQRQLSRTRNGAQWLLPMDYTEFGCTRGLKLCGSQEMVKYRASHRIKTQNSIGAGYFRTLNFPNLFQLREQTKHDFDQKQSAFATVTNKVFLLIIFLNTYFLRRFQNLLSVRTSVTRRKFELYHFPSCARGKQWESAKKRNKKDSNGLSRMFSDIGGLLCFSQISKKLVHTCYQWLNNCAISPDDVFFNKTMCYAGIDTRMC